MTDIRFTGDWVVAEASVLKTTANDLMLDAPSRRQGAGDFRRALVHDFTDGLTVNWDTDYPGGVTLNGTRQINAFHGNDWLVVRARVHQQFGTDLMLDGGTERRRQSAFVRPLRPTANPYRRALVHGWEDTLVVNWNEDYRGGVVVNGRVSMPGGATIAGQDIAAALTTLTGQLATMSIQVSTLTSTVTDLGAKVADLDARVTALEAGQ